MDPKHAKFDKNPSFGHVRAVGGIMGYSGSVNFRHLLRLHALGERHVTGYPMVKRGRKERRKEE